MDSVFGLCGDDWVIIAADSTVAYSIMKLKVRDRESLVLDKIRGDLKIAFLFILEGI